jgi:peptidoglycan hydrolase-like protein with peptidoglycan-binding domain
MKRILMISALVAGLSVTPMVAASGSDTVRAAQQALKDKGFDPGTVDGLNGPRTRSAVKAYQKQQNLETDGRLDDPTLASLGVQKSAGAHMDAAGSNLKNGYSAGGKQVGDGGKALADGVKHDDIIKGTKQFGKDVGHGVEKMGKSTGHAAENAAKGTADATKNAATATKDATKSAADKVTGK